MNVIKNQYDEILDKMMDPDHEIIKNLIVPEFIDRKMSNCHFKYNNKDFFYKYLDNNLRVIVMYTLFLFGNKKNNDTCIIDNHNNPFSITKNQLLTYAFYNVPVDSRITHEEKSTYFNFTEKRKYNKHLMDRVSHPCYFQTFDKTIKRTYYCRNVSKETSNTHHCFGECGHIKENKQEIINNNQIFDFNRFIISIKKASDNDYSITFDSGMHGGFRHASFTNAISCVKTSEKCKYNKLTYVNTIKIKIIPNENNIQIESTYYAIDCL